MEVLQLTTTVDASGHLLLDIPTKLAPGQVSIVLVVNPIAESEPQTMPKMHYDFTDLAGQLMWQGDAVTTQRALRDE